MKKHILCTIIASLVCVGVIQAQKLRNKRADVKYVSLPAQVLPAEFMTYSVQVQGHSSATNRIKMDGFKRMAGGGEQDGHLRVVINSGYAHVAKGKFTSETRTRKDKDDKETKTTYYWYNFPVSCYTSYRIVDPAGNILANAKHDNSDTHKSREYTSSAALAKAYSSLYQSAKKSIQKKSSDRIFSTAQQAIDTQFDYDLRTASPQIHWVTKHDTESAFEAHKETTLGVFAAASHFAASAELQDKLAKPIEFWKSQLQDGYKMDKKLSRVYVAAGLNLAVVSMYLDQFDAAEDYAKMVLAADDKEKDAKRIIERIGKLRPIMEEHGLNTLHHWRDLENAKPPAELAALEELQEELAEDNENSRGKVILNGEIIEGEFFVDKEADDFIFGESGNVKFLLSGDGEIEEIDLCHSDVESFVIDDRSFRKMMFVPRAKGESKESQCILEEIYESEKINLYKYYPISSSLSDASTEFAFQKASEENLVSLHDTQFLILKKGLANYFSDCADLEEMCSEGTFAMERDDLIKAARIYSEVCE